MSDEDQSLKSEEPSQRKLEEAARKGDVFKSQEVNNLFSIFIFALVLVWLGPVLAQKTLVAASHYITMPHDIEVTVESLPLLFRDATVDMVIILLPLLLMAVAAAIVSNLVQHAPIFTFETIMPKPEKINPIKGLQRLFSMRSISEFVKSLLKLTVVFAVGYIVIEPLMKQLEGTGDYTLIGILEEVQLVSLDIVMGVLILMVIITLLDFSYQKFEYMKKMRMSKTELKEEHKQSEGDPHVKAKLRRIRMERAQRRMMASVPKADVIITNPTHYSIALQYDQKMMAAPVLVAKGVDAVAMRIREVAKEHNIPLVENPPLARGLFDAVEIDEAIPLEYYQAVAEVISYVYRLKQKAAA